MGGKHSLTTLNNGRGENLASENHSGNTHGAGSNKKKQKKKRLHIKC